DPFPHGTVSVGPNRGRLGTLYWTADDGIAIGIGTWDHELGVECLPFVGKDGVFRCLPRRPKQVTAYLDATCSGSSLAVSAACDGAAPMYGTDYTSCADSGEVDSMTVVGTSAHAEISGTCTDLPAPGGVYSVGSGSLPPTMFPELAEVVE